jgi:hypothetical protein
MLSKARLRQTKAMCFLSHVVNRHNINIDNIMKKVNMGDVLFIKE